MKVIDMHCDTIYRLLCLKERGTPEELRRNGCHLDLMRMRDSHYLLQNFALFVELDRDGDPWERVCGLYQHYRVELERNQDLIAPVLRYEDIAANEAAGKMSAMLTVEEGAVCKGEIGKLRKLYEMGVRMMTLTWNFPNEIGSPNFDGELGRKAMEVKKAWEQCEPGTAEYERKREEAQAAFEAFNRTSNTMGGLTEKGKEMVAEMERLGMIPDVSHLSDAGFYDVLAVTRKPFVASHSNARSVCPCVRNMTDDMIRKLAERGGVMGLNYCADFLEEKLVGVENQGSIRAVARHAQHIANVGGIEALGLGSDFDGISAYEEIPGAQGMEALWNGMRRAGFTESQLDMIFYRNVLRVYKETL
ncbi:MAG: dipeptidase [Blautia sp.]|nr:dipeptidase [Blautia sp.]